MKSSTLIASATALIGFATGWLLKPSGEAESGTTAPAAATGNGSASGKSAERSKGTLILKTRGSGKSGSAPDVTEGGAGTASAHIAFERNFENATERAENARLARFAEALGLSPEQRESMEVMLANRRDGFRQLNGGGRKPSEMLAQAAQAERRFEQQLAQILDPEQAEAYTALRAREKENSIEAKAQRDLADLIGQVDLSEEQRELALEAMRAGSSEAQAKRPAGWTLMNESMSILGGGQASAMEEVADFMGDDAAMGDTQEFHRRLVESKRDALTQTLERLAPILTPGQLAQYRSTLEARTAMLEQFTPPKFEKR